MTRPAVGPAGQRPGWSATCRAVCVALGLVVLAGAFLVSAGADPVDAGPVAPAEPTGECELVDDGQSVRFKGYGHGFANDGEEYFVNNGLPFYDCRGVREAADIDAGATTDNIQPEPVTGCVDIGQLNSFGENKTAQVFCPGPGALGFMCRDEIDGRPDAFGMVLIPGGYRDSDQEELHDWEWWVDEIYHESLDVTYRREDEDGRTTGDLGDNKNLGAMGCELGSNPPTAQCAVIRREILDRYARIGNAHGRDGDGSRIERLREEIDGLRNRGGLVPDDCWGTLPTANYHVSWSSKRFSLEELMGWMSVLLFGFAKMAVGTALWLLGMAFVFDVTRYVGTVAEIATRFDRELIHFGSHSNAFTLFDIAWFALFAGAGIQMIRGRVGRGVAEVATTVALAALAASFMTVDTSQGWPEHRLSVSRPFLWMGELVDRSSGSMLVIGDDSWELNHDLYCAREAILDSEGRPTDRTRPIRGDRGTCNPAFREHNLRDLLYANQGVIHEEFVERPYMYINYGQELLDSDPCMEAINNTVATGYESQRGWVQRYLDRVSQSEDDVNCGEVAKTNSKMTVNRLMTTVFMGTVALVVAVLMAVTAVTLLVAKFWLAVLFMVAPLVAVAAIPEATRKVVWWWLATLVQVWLAASAMGVMISLVMIMLSAVHETTADMPLAERWLMVLLLLSVLWILRKQLVTGSRSAASAISDKLTGATRGNEAVAWAGSRPGGGGADLNVGERATLGALATGTRIAGGIARSGVGLAGHALTWSALSATGTVGLVGRSRIKRRDENRMAAKNLRNLEIMDNLRRRRDLAQRHATRRRSDARRAESMRRPLADRQAARTTDLRARARRGRARVQDWFDGREEAREKAVAPWKARVRRDRDALQRAYDERARVPTDLKGLLGFLDDARKKPAEMPDDVAAKARTFGIGDRDIARWNRQRFSDRARARNAADLRAKAEAGAKARLADAKADHGAARMRLKASQDAYRKQAAANERAATADRERLARIRAADQARERNDALRNAREMGPVEEQARRARRQREKRHGDEWGAFGAYLREAESRTPRRSGAADLYGRRVEKHDEEGEALRRSD